MTKSRRKAILVKLDGVEKGIDKSITHLYEIEQQLDENYPNQMDAISRMVLVLTASLEVVRANRKLF